MKEYVAKRSRRGVSKTDIIAINAMANKDASLGNLVINASIGTFLDNEKHVGKVKLISDSLQSHVSDKLGYSGVLGNPDYLQGVLKYIFKDNLEKINSLYSPFIGATLGGTGAISLGFNIFLEEGEAVLLPDVMWTNYKLIAEKAHNTFLTYEMFTKDGHLNLQSIKKTIEEARDKYQRVLLVINDPCQNPTGYCMTEEEYDELFSLLNEEGRKGYLVCFFDIAYISFYHVAGHNCALVDKLVEKKTDFLPLIAFSCSKLFGLYGLRVGALLALCATSDDKENVSRAFGAMARGTYSVPVGPVQYAISTILNDETKIKELEDEIKENRDELYKRSETLIKELEKANIDYYPYMSGFFITLKIDHAFDVYEKLKKQHIYVVPMNENSIRLAISGLTSDEIITLVKALKDTQL